MILLFGNDSMLVECIGANKVFGNPQLTDRKGQLKQNTPPKPWKKCVSFTIFCWFVVCLFAVLSFQATSSSSVHARLYVSFACLTIQLLLVWLLLFPSWICFAFSFFFACLLASVLFVSMLGSILLPKMSQCYQASMHTWKPVWDPAISNWTKIKAICVETGKMSALYSSIVALISLFFILYTFGRLHLSKASKE